MSEYNLCHTCEYADWDGKICNITSAKIQWGESNKDCVHYKETKNEN